MGSYLDQAIERLKEFEGSVPWMYLDTGGKVTVGVGAMLPDAKSAGALPFQMGERAATPEEIAADFVRVSGLAKGKVAAFYRKKNGLRLTDEVIDKRLRDVLEGFESYLRDHVPGYEELPDAAKLGLLDMVYNLGPGKLFREVSAADGGDWTWRLERGGQGELAQGAERGPRNAWTRQQFLDAAKRIALQAEAAMEHGAWPWVDPLFWGPERPGSRGRFVRGDLLHPRH